jgi:hypothetical protein
MCGIKDFLVFTIIHIQYKRRGEVQLIVFVFIINVNLEMTVRSGVVTGEGWGVVTDADRWMLLVKDF